MDRFLIVDGNSIANRAFYALPFLTSHKGNPSGAIYGFASILLKIIGDMQPSHIAVAFDHSRKTFRNKIFKDYKATRKETPRELIEQFPLVKEMLSVMGIQIFEVDGIEADDIIGTIAQKTALKKVLLSGDRDLLQLIDKDTEVWLTKKGVSEVEKLDEATLLATRKLKPEQIIDLKALMGDASDNIPGVKGVGEKTALSLLEKYFSLDNVYQNVQQIGGKLAEKLENGKADAYMSKTLATIKTDCEFDFDEEKCRLNLPFGQSALDFFNEWDFASLLKQHQFFGDKTPTRPPEKVVMLGSLEEVDSLAKSAKEWFGFDMRTLRFACDQDVCYCLNPTYDMFSSNLETGEVLQRLKAVFEDKNILKITKNAKSDLHTLKNFGINLVNFFDLNLASYVNFAGVKLPEIKQSPTQYFLLYEEAKRNLSTSGTENIYYQIELPLVEILAQMEDYGFKINEDKLDGLSEEFSAKIDVLTKEIYSEAGEVFNINSPKQVANILFDKLGIKTYGNKKASTSVGVLEELRFIPIVDNILHYRKLVKIKNTYIDVYKSICAASGSVIHTNFNQTQTSTGRLSSSEPNLQNIPTRDEEGRELRKIFISKFEGGSLISADYNQIELRLLAHMSGEEHLISAYNEGRDIHTLTASQIFGVSEGEVTESMRREAKAVNFGIIYGISDYGLSQNIKQSREKAKAYINSYFSRYPKVKEFMNKNVDTATAQGQITTMFGRIRKIPELSSSKFSIRNFGQRVAMNMPLQGTASDIIKMAMINVFSRIKKEGLKSQLILQIHDELIVDVAKGEEEKVTKLLKDEMENVCTLSVPLPAKIGIGKSLYDCK